MSEFEIVKSNEAILKKIRISDYYLKHNGVFKPLLDYEGYNFDFYHKKMINKDTGNEVYVCFGYSIELVDPENQKFVIDNNYYHLYLINFHLLIKLMY